jgi:hypothetical protein
VVLDLVQPGDHRLLQLDEEHEGEDLPAVGVTGELEIDPMALGLGGLARLVGEEDPRRALGGALERAADVGGVLGALAYRALFGDGTDEARVDLTLPVTEGEESRPADGTMPIST